MQNTDAVQFKVELCYVKICGQQWALNTRKPLRHKKWLVQIMCYCGFQSKWRQWQLDVSSQLENFTGERATFLRTGVRKPQHFRLHSTWISRSRRAFPWLEFLVKGTCRYSPWKGRWISGNLCEQALWDMLYHKGQVLIRQEVFL